MTPPGLQRLVHRPSFRPLTVFTLPPESPNVGSRTLLKQARLPWIVLVATSGLRGPRRHGRTLACYRYISPGLEAPRAAGQIGSSAASSSTGGHHRVAGSSVPVDGDR